MVINMNKINEKIRINNLKNCNNVSDIHLVCKYCKKYQYSYMNNNHEYYCSICGSYNFREK